MGPPQRRHHPPGTDLDNLVWLERAQDFMDTYGFPQDLLESVVRSPESTEVDPSSPARGYPVLRHRRGDITVLVGYKTPGNPSVVFIHLHNPEEDNSRGSTQGAGQGAGSTGPKSLRQLRAALVKLGCSLDTKSEKIGPTGHNAVYYQGIRVGTLVSTPGDHREYINKYKQISRRVAAAKAMRKLRRPE